MRRQEWWLTPIIQALRAGAGDCKFSASLGYTARPGLKGLLFIYIYIYIYI
jgi:hypothetical protein